MNACKFKSCISQYRFLTWDIGGNFPTVIQLGAFPVSSWASNTKFPVKNPSSQISSASEINLSLEIGKPASYSDKLKRILSLLFFQSEKMEGLWETKMDNIGDYTSAVGAGALTPPFIENGQPLEELLLIRRGSRNTTTTVISSWKCLLTPLSIFFRSEYLISLFFAASWSAVLTSFRAIPYITKVIAVWNNIIVTSKIETVGPYSVIYHYKSNKLMTSSTYKLPIIKLAICNLILLKS